MEPPTEPRLCSVLGKKAKVWRQFLGGKIMWGLKNIQPTIGGIPTKWVAPHPTFVFFGQLFPTAWLTHETPRHFCLQLLKCLAPIIRQLETKQTFKTTPQLIWYCQDHFFIYTHNIYIYHISFLYANKSLYVFLISYFHQGWLFTFGLIWIHSWRWGNLETALAWHRILFEKIPHPKTPLQRVLLWFNMI